MHWCPCRVETTENLHHRIRLDRRRLEYAHLKFAMLTVQINYSSIATDPISMETDISKSLAPFTIRFYEAFSQKYARK